MNQPVHVQATGKAKARFTAAEFEQMAAAGAFADMKVELIDGELERMNPPMSNHGAQQASIVIRLASAMDGRSDLIMGEVGIQLSDDTIVGCDAAILHAPVLKHRLLVPGDVLLVIEVAETTLDRDTGMKRRKYAENGIAHYWVVDGPRRVIHVYGEPVAGDYAQIATVRFGDPLPVPGTDASIAL